jgi:hypothetical protein
MLTIKYQINLTVKNQLTGIEYPFTKTFTKAFTLSDKELYDNFHVISTNTHITEFFSSEINALTTELGINPLSLTVEAFDINSLSTEADVYFESETPESNISLTPIIKCYVKPKYGVMTCSKTEGCESRTIEVLASKNIKYYMTKNGSIRVLSNGEDIKIIN